MSLTRSGHFAFDFFHPNLALLGEPKRSTLDLEREQDGVRVQRFATIESHRASQILDIHFRWEITDAAGGSRQKEIAFKMRWFYRFELEHLLARAGLEIVALHGDFQGRPFADESPEMIFVTRALD